MRAWPTAEVLRPEPMTLEQWADLAEDEPGELRDAMLVEEEVPTNLHEVIVSWLMWALNTWAVPRQALVFGSEHKLAVSERRGRKPDVCMYAPGIRLAAHQSLSRTPPALIVEVVSSRARDVRRDRLDKVIEYAHFGVHWYWLLDPEARVLEILELGDEGCYVLRKSVGDGAFEVPGFQGLELDLTALWARAEAMLSDEGEAEAESGKR